VIFAFGGNALIATSFYVVQRTSRARLWGGNLAWFVFWGYQLFIVLAATGYLLGATQGQGIRRARMVRGPVADHRLGRLSGGLPRHAPEAQGAAHLRGQLVLPELHRHHRDAARRQQPGDAGVVLRLQERSVFSGVQDAMTQWWYGHNAVGFFLTAGFLGMMYYFVPKQAERPVYSYKLSIIHFWALIFLYIWAGPHHLHYTALPDWASTLGMVFSIVLWMPSWGGMINGLMTLSGAWDKLRTDPIIRMMVISVGLLRHVDLRRPDDVDPAVNSLSTTPTGPSATCTPARWAGTA
jgi:cytochrome c oxidase cbb3-type subunit 1